MSGTFSTIFTAPFLALVSIPLVFFAYITIWFSAVALFLRLFVICIELCYAIISSYFVIPTSSNSSLLNFASEPTTPAALNTPKRRSIDNGVTMLVSQSTIHRQPAPLSHDQNRSASVRRRTSSISLGPHEGDHSRPPHKDNRRRKTPTTPPAPLLSLISGDEGRDFEGLGGWRCPPFARPQSHPSRSASSSSKDSLSEGADDRAWLSINHRLELPSQPFPLRNHSETADFLPWTHSQPASQNPEGRTERHHHRAATTSLLPSQTRRAPPSPSMARPHRSRAVSPRPQSQHIMSTHSDFFRAMASAPQTHAHLSGLSDAAGGYFAFRPGTGVNSRESATTTPGSTTPVEDRSASGSVGRFMAHYPTGVRYRRQSMSGSYSGSQLPSPVLGRDRTM
ncbi:uncharacterized protein ACLA_030700 [Aspergillus clavatus NRRL 1]|uniref:Uncharacterized protein n=1 Tax=Aspergillus clavatus (strain ATCC 1007 / CBS 513.65 / DSM 816 / NCTC 3887 / NRRL 1 / QM 1276 / 107) TaxID=344612 RepID=A1CRR6_ASPCL|nr:uncharacterized protein ACLA_030700 [Aspergillus clavatus NRRL 1]EAW08337.1 conserved hypothetical protein [Aspergillus clavatus NRRL 1]